VVEDFPDEATPGAHTSAVARVADETRGILSVTYLIRDERLRLDPEQHGGGLLQVLELAPPMLDDRALDVLTTKRAQLVRRLRDEARVLPRWRGDGAFWRWS
jgi:hypothetical protein